MKINQGYIPVCGCVNDRYRFSAIQTVAVCFSKVFARPVNQDRSHGCEPSDWLFRGRGSKLPRDKAQASLRTPKARPWSAVACYRPGLAKLASQSPALKAVKKFSEDSRPTGRLWLL
jgi:hypothetical protein